MSAVLRGAEKAGTVPALADRPGFTGRYRSLWVFLLMGWLISYADRTVTGPVISWMIANKAGFIGDAANPATSAAWSGPCSSPATCSPSTRADGWATGSATARCSCSP